MSKPFNLGDTTPEFTTVTIERDGKTVELKAYVYGDRCPGLVKSRLATAMNVKTRDAQAMAHLKPADARENWAPDDVWLDYLRAVVQAFIPEITNEEADAVAGNNTLVFNLLVHLGFWISKGEEANADNPPPKDDQQTTPEYAQTSLPLESVGA